MVYFSLYMCCHIVMSYSFHVPSVKLQDIFYKIVSKVSI